MKKCGDPYCISPTCKRADRDPHCSNTQKQERKFYSDDPDIFREKKEKLLWKLAAVLMAKEMEKRAYASLDATALIEYYHELAEKALDF